MVPLAVKRRDCIPAATRYNGETLDQLHQGSEAVIGHAVLLALSIWTENDTASVAMISA
jgi:hypothetical protein